MEVDARLLGRPPKFDGSENAWPDWSFQVRAYLETVHGDMGSHLDLVQAAPDVPLVLSGMNPSETCFPVFYRSVTMFAVYRLKTK